MIDARVLVRIAKRRQFLETRIAELEAKAAAVQNEIDGLKAERRTLTNEALAAEHGVASSSIDRYLRSALDGSAAPARKAPKKRAAAKRAKGRKAGKRK